MNAYFSIKPTVSHLSRVILSDYFSEKTQLFSILSEDEKVRASRFKFDIHRDRFIVSRGILRHLLSHYLQIKPENIIFSYGKHGKPFLKNVDLHFNVSHSEDMAVFAFANSEVGVDIEKIKTFKEDVAKRFFNHNEYQQLMQLPKEEQLEGFYQIWSKKEAFIKLIGTGVFVSLQSFSVDARSQLQKIVWNEKEYFIQDLFIDEQYKAALATLHPMTLEYYDIPDFTY